MTARYLFDRLLIGFAFVIACAAVSVSAQTAQQASASANQIPKVETAGPPAPVKTAALQPAIHSLREVELGMSADEAKHKLGRPEVQDDTGMYFTLSGGDSVQIGLGEDKKVRTVAVIYAAGSKNAPSLADVFGPDVEKVAGDTYKMVRYPDAGYWVSYSRTNSGDKPVVIVTMKKMSQ